MCNSNDTRRPPFLTAEWRQLAMLNYGEDFREFLTGTPASALFAEGSPITVHQGRRLAP